MKIEVNGQGLTAEEIKSAIESARELKNKTIKDIVASNEQMLLEIIALCCELTDTGNADYPFSVTASLYSSAFPRRIIEGIAEKKPEILVEAIRKVQPDFLQKITLCR